MVDRPVGPVLKAAPLLLILFAAFAVAIPLLVFLLLPITFYLPRPPLLAFTDVRFEIPSPRLFTAPAPPRAPPF